ncbi:putative fucosyltransferase-like protein isoform X2 [Nymphaea colorata]|uniref:putative fucosyltransferase-like protein isoform X2 n=1 Tax=Nymphaea colorata TaxID=210225 RepID=UPI00129DA1D7|nr:putative fucosyltransferase-like protein isoform X2 [Nymphaea colorata]
MNWARRRARSGWRERTPSPIRGISWTTQFGFGEEYKTCSVGCTFEDQSKSGKKPDAAFGMHPNVANVNILRSMESSHYYSDNKIDHARRRGFNIVMTTSLSSDVPVGYFSWAEYDIMAPIQPKTEPALAAAFISNCGARNFRLEALNMLEKSNITVDSYGGCHRNRDGNVDKVETLKKYKFSLAFENSNEEDYVTEKFFQSLVAGTVPVVVGAPNILDFAPAPSSILHIRTLDDIPSVATTMQFLAENPRAYNESLRWKFEGPSDSFKALIDMAAVHSSCRLCIYLATAAHEKEEQSNPGFQKRPCKCEQMGETIYHLFVRERGRFEMKSVLLSSSNLTLQALESAVFKKFKSENHIPIWKDERPEILRRSDYKVHKIYPVGLTQRQALYTFKFNGDADFKQFVESHPCAKLEVIFV